MDDSSLHMIVFVTFLELNQYPEMGTCFVSANNKQLKQKLIEKWRCGPMSALPSPSLIIRIGLGGELKTFVSSLTIP